MGIRIGDHLDKDHILTGVKKMEEEGETMKFQIRYVSGEIRVFSGEEALAAFSEYEVAVSARKEYCRFGSVSGRKISIHMKNIEETIMAWEED